MGEKKVCNIFHVPLYKVPKSCLWITHSSLYDTPLQSISYAPLSMSYASPVYAFSTPVYE